MFFEFTEGDPVGGIQATVVTDDWLNDVQGELISVLADQAITPVKGLQNQLLAAIKGIAGTQATESIRGAAKVATQTQTNAGVDDSTIVTPKKLRAGFSALYAVNGYLALPTWLGGLIFQWGSFTGSSSGLSQTFAYPLTFPTACVSVSMGTTSSPSGSVEYGQIVSTTNIGPSIATYTNISAPTVGSLTFTWFALGIDMASYYVVVDSSGAITQRLVDSVHVIPKGAIPVTGEQWLEIMQNTSESWTIQKDGTFVFAAAPAPAIYLPEIIASTRYDHETAGIEIDGVLISTDRDRQALITGAAVSAILDSEYVCTWKTVNRPVRLTASQLIEIATAVRAHVQACFDREGVLLAAVNNETYTDAMLTQGWPPAAN